MRSSSPATEQIIHHNGHRDGGLTGQPLDIVDDPGRGVHVGGNHQLELTGFQGFLDILESRPPTHQSSYKRP